MATGASALSSQDIADLQEISGRLPAGDPRRSKISLLLNSQPTQFEKDRTPGSGSGFLPHAGSALKGLAGGIANLAFSPSEIAASTAKQAGQMGVDAAARQQEGRSAAYQVAAPVAQLAVPGLNPRAMEQAANRGDTSGVLGEAAVPTALALAAPVAEGAAKVTRPTRVGLAQKVVSPLVYENLGETGADVRMGINPEKALTTEGLAGMSKQSLLDKAQARTAELKAAADNILQNHPNSNVQIDAEPMIDAAIDNAIKNTKKIAGSTDRLEALRTALKTEYGPTTGTPFEINNLKTDIQQAANSVGAYKNTQPVEASIAAAMGDVASRIRAKVNDVVPNAAPLNQRMADLIDAQGGLQKNINAQRGRSSFGGFHEGATTRFLNNTLGSAGVRSTLARALMAGDVQGVPSPITYQAPALKGLLGPGATELGMGADTSGPVPASERINPMVWTPEMMENVARRTPAAPPNSPSVTGIGSVYDPNLLGTRGTGGTRTVIKGLLGEGTPYTPRTPVSQVGRPPVLGFPAITPDQMWSPRAVEPSPGFDLPSGQPIITPGGPPPPEFAYRTRTAGVPDIDLRAHAHATANPEEAQGYVNYRNEGVNQKVSRIDLSRFKPGEVQVVNGPNGGKWYKFNRPLTSDDYLD